MAGTQGSVPMSAPMSEAAPEPRSPLERVRNTLRLLYHGRTAGAVRFQLAVLIVDVSIIAFFIASPLLRGQPAFLWLDIAVAVILVVDIVARCLASTDIWRWLRQLTTIVDLVILATLLFPTWLANFGFLRILRLWTLSRSGFLWRPLKRRGLNRWEETGSAVVNLVTFIFLMTGFVYTFFARGEDARIITWIDALYFTVAAATTTGFGDIVLPGAFGKLTSIIVMVLGITLLVRLAQAIVRPYKVHFSCPQCGLQRHEPDAVHCKACGHLINIPDEGH